MRYSIQRSGDIFTRLLSFLAMSLVFAAFLGGALTSAVPVNNLQTARRTIFARACPTVTDLVPHLQARGLGGNTVFYTKPMTNQQAQAFAATLHPPGQGFFSLVSFDDRMAWIDQCNEPGPGQNKEGEQNKLTPRISQALAQGATGTAYILISAGADINAPGSIWGNVEFPTLQRNPAITEVIRVDAADPQSKTTVWNAGDPVTLPPSTAA